MDREKEPVSISEFPGVSEPLDIVRFLKSHLEYSPYTSAIVVGTVGGAVLFQTIFRKLEAWVEGKRHAQEVLQLIFKELAILGLVAFTLFAIDIAETPHMDQNLISTIDVIHMAIFIVTVLYTIFCALILYLSTVTGRKWKYLEDIDIYNYNNLRSQCDAINDTVGLRRDQVNSRLKRWYVAIMHPILYQRRRRLMRHLAYQEIRASFIRDNNMPANFRFVTYLDKCKQHVVLQLAEIGEGAWITLAVFVAFSMYYQAVRNISHLDIFSVVLFTTIVSVVVVLLVRTKVNSAYEELLYAETYFAEELKDMIQLQNLFWFGRPRFLVLAFQFSQFALSVSSSVFLQSITTFTRTQNLVTGTTLIIAIFVYIATLPQVISDFSMIANVGNLVNKRLLASALLKQQAGFKDSVAPTLRQATMLAKIEHKEQNLTMKQRVSRMMPSSLFHGIMNYCILATNVDKNDNVWHWTWYETLEVTFSLLFMVEGLLVIYALGLRCIIRFEHPGINFDLFIIFITTSSSIITAIYLSLTSLSSVDFDFIAYLDIIIVLRLIRWTRRIFVSEIRGQELEAHLSEVRILLKEQSDTRALGGCFNNFSNNMNTHTSTAQLPESSPCRVSPTPSLCNDSVVPTVSPKSLKGHLDGDDERRFYKLKQTESHAQTERERKTGPLKKQESIVHHPAQQQARKFELGHLPDERSMDGSTNHSLSYNVIVEAWMRTCESHPDVTALHGNLSVAILRLMLNLPAEKAGTPASLTVFPHCSLTNISCHSASISERTSTISEKLASSSMPHKSKRHVMPRIISVRDDYIRQPNVRRSTPHIKEIDESKSRQEDPRNFSSL